MTWRRPTSGTLGLDDARTALGGVLELAPDLVGLQEWYPSRYRLLQDTGRLGPVPQLGRRLRRGGTGPDYLWNAPLVGGCAVGARADRFELIRCRPQILSWVGRADRPDRWLRVEPPRVATVALYRHRLSRLTVCLVSYHLAPGVQAGGRYRADRPILVSRHRREVRNLERLVEDQLFLGHLVFAAGDSNFDGLRVAGLTSAWQGLEDEPGTLGPRRKVDDVHGPGAAESVTLSPASPTTRRSSYVVRCECPDRKPPSGCGQAVSVSVVAMTTTPQLTSRRRQMLNKVPEVTLYFWIIKILCTTVGESFADYINETLGFGLTNTTLVFSAALIAVLVAQFRLRRYVPGTYWLAVVLISVVGTLLTDNLTDGQGVPLWVSTTVFAALLALVFGVWYARERTLSIHSIVTTTRESFYWLTVLVTFALGTAVGDWTLELTGWSAGVSVLLPLGLIAAVLVAWKLGAGPVLSFWVAYILTRPLGANIGDFLASPRADGGLGLGTLGTSVVFLGTILAVVIYLTKTHKDQTELTYQPQD